MPYATTWIQLEIIILSKSERERQIPYDITYMQNLNYGTYEPIYKTQTDSQDRIVVAGLRVGSGWGMDWEFGAGRCKLLHLEWIDKNVG